MRREFDRRAAREQAEGIVGQRGADALDGAERGVERAADDCVVGVGRQRSVMAGGMRQIGGVGGERCAHHG